jgi:hypothetical protein
MIRKLLIFLTLLINLNNINAQYIPDSEVDNGIYLNETEENATDERIPHFNIEKEFTNPHSRERIYYTGQARSRWREGQFWIKNNCEKKVILEAWVKYGPIIKWHGENIAEFFIPTGSPFRHSYFYNFRTGITSEPYDFPVYVDREKERLIIWAAGDIEVYDIVTDKLIHNYHFSDTVGLSAPHPYMYGLDYDIKIENNKITISYEDNYPDEAKKGSMIYDY